MFLKRAIKLKPHRLAFPLIRLQFARAFAASTKPQAIQVKNDSSSEKIKLPKMDWDDWAKQYPDRYRYKADVIIDGYKKAENTCDFNPEDIPTIDWEYWRKEIKTPGAVDILKAELDSTDSSPYGPFYYDSLTKEARDEMLKPGSVYEEEVDTIGREFVKNGVEQSFNEENRKRIVSAKSLTENSALVLEELQKDKEQMDMFFKRYPFRSLDEELAEFPDVAREIEENIAGNGFGNGNYIFWNDELREVDMMIEKEDFKDKQYAEYSLRQNEDEINEYIKVLGDMGFEVDKKHLVNEVYENHQRDLEKLRRYCRETRSLNSYDPKTGEMLFQEIDDSNTKIPGGG